MDTEKKSVSTEEIVCCNCGSRLKHRDEKEYNNLINRLNRIEGQVRGIKNMVEEERYCIDIINQVSATSAALKAFSQVLLSEHIKTCVKEDIEAGNLETIDELCSTIKKLMK